MLLSIHPDNPEERKVKQVIECLQDGGVIIYPTDTVYAFGCDIFQQNAIEKICRLRQIDPKKANLTFICKDVSQISQYTLPIDNQIFRMMKAELPGAVTYILRASNHVPKLFKNNKKTVGVRIPDHKITQTFIEALGNPMLSTSLKDTEDEILEYFTDPQDIYERYGNQVDIVIDGGIGGYKPSKIVDCTGDAPVVVRE